jgi:signal transduction histidine kinase/ActR/RegA family two-component response regulator
LVFEDIGYKPTLVYIFYNLGSIYRNTKDYQRSYEYFEKGLELATEISMRDYISYNYEALSGLYEEMGYYNKALSYYKDYVQVKDSLLNEEKYRQIEEMEAQFQNAQHQKEIEYLKIDHDLKELQLKKKEIQNLILIISAVLALVIVLILWRFNRAQKKSANALKNEIEERVKTEDKLIEIKEELEQRVVERTADLEQSNKKLISEINEHEKTAERLIIAKDKAEEADRLKSNFLANMSHEIRTPMNAISGFSQMLTFDDITAQKRKEYADKIMDGCKNLTNLIEEIMDFAEVDAGDISIENKEFNPHPILEYLSDKYTAEILDKGKENLKLIYHNENTENDIVINTDITRLKQIISILLDNAIKFTDEGVIEFGFTHPNDKELHFFVKDTGIGIDEKHEETIFERFRQIDDGISKTYGGAGIGLSVAKKLVELLGGEIWLDSSLNRGSTFYFSLPFNFENELREDDLQNIDWSDKLILVAEDKEINFEIIKETLSITNVNLIWAKNGEETLKELESNPKIDLILMDIQMPVMDGYECTRRIKEINSDITVIAQTAYALPQDSYKCFEAGCDDYIAKPISLNQLLEKVNKHLSKVKSQ